VLLIAASGLLYEGSLFFLAPSADYRYSHYLVYTSVLSTLLLIRTFVGVALPRHASKRERMQLQRVQTGEV